MSCIAGFAAIEVLGVADVTGAWLEFVVEVVTSCVTGVMVVSCILQRFDGRDLDGLKYHRHLLDSNFMAVAYTAADVMVVNHKSAIKSGLHLAFNDDA